jgi:hypothetical protein
MKNTQPHTANIGRLLWVLVSAYTCYFVLHNVKYKLVIKKGFVYDKASVPIWAWSLLGVSSSGQHDSGTIFHDLIYYLIKIAGYAIVGREEDKCTHELYAWIDEKWVRSTIKMSKTECDNIMFQIIRNTENVVLNRALRTRLRLMHVGVSIGGGKYWRKVKPNHEINPEWCEK